MKVPEALHPVESAFDAAAATFDEMYENSITRQLRERVTQRVLSLTPSSGRLLDINCGTGIDAIEYARRGLTVVGCDLSANMIARANAKKSVMKIPHVSFLQTSFEDLAVLPLREYDVVTSNFGGLNCVADLSGVAAQIAAVLRPGGFFCAVVMPPVSLWEISSNAVRGKFRKALRRLGKGAAATGFSQSFDVFYHSPSSLRRAFYPWFEVHSLEGMNVISPPPHAARFADRWPQMTNFLDHLDRKINRWPILNSLGDHYVILLKRRSRGQHSSHVQISEEG